MVNRGSIARCAIAEQEAYHGSGAARGLSVDRPAKTKTLSHSEYPDRLRAIHSTQNRPSRRLPALARAGSVMSSNHNLNDQRSNTMKFPTPPPDMTEAQIDAGIDEALEEAVKRGTLVNTGKTQWSKRRRRLIPIYMCVPCRQRLH
jgi:alkylhydroperoxidase/carboxymuconolactone decarboxylase family protein YurZ